MHDYETVTTAAKLTNITPRTIYKYLKQGIVANFGTDVILVSVKQVRETNNKRKPQTINWDTIQQHIKQQQTISQIASELSISASNLYARCKKDNGVSWREWVKITLCKP
jgi:DNA invertase Pin-like site-specific DNA recombinase